LPGEGKIGAKKSGRHLKGDPVRLVSLLREESVPSKGGTPPFYTPDMKIWLTARALAPRFIGKDEGGALGDTLGVNLGQAAGFDTQGGAAMTLAGTGIVDRRVIRPVLDHMKCAAVAQVLDLNHLPGIAEA
jgi:hypothetical protein